MGDKVRVRGLFGVVFAVVAVVGLTACGNATVSPAVGSASVASISPPTFSGASTTPFAISGFDYSQVVGTPVIVRVTATSGTPFLGGTQASIDVPGQVTSAGEVVGDMPPTCIDGGMSVNADVVVIFPSGFVTQAGLATFEGPMLAGGNGNFAPATVPSDIPQAFSLDGSNLGDVGDTLTVRFEATGGVNVFEGGTSSTVEVSGTITATGVDGTTPPAVVCGIPNPTASFTLVLTNLNCSDPPPEVSSVGPVVTFEAPTVAGLNVAGFVANDAPSTILIGNATPETFSLTGTGFAPNGGSATMTFSGAGIFDGGANSVDVLGTIVSDTTITGTLPTITNPRLTADAMSSVQVTLPSGSCTPVNVDLVTLLAPPTVTGVTSNLAVREGGAATFLTACATQMRIAGTTFDVGGAVSITDGGGTPIGPGALADENITATLITGLSPTDSGVAADVLAQVRVVNLDGQFHDFTDLTTPFEFVTYGHLENQNVSMQPTRHNAEMEAAVDPTDPHNLATLVHNIGTNEILLAYSTDAGTTWQRNFIGPADDGLAADRIDPRCAYDRFGNLYVCYFNRAPRTLVVLQSFDKGASFANQRTVFASFSIDKQFMVIGPNGADPTEEAIYVGWDDPAGTATGTGGIVAGGATCAGPGMALSAFSPPVQVASGGGQQFSNADVGPNGDLYVVWNDRAVPGDVGGAGPVTIRLAVDPLGLFAGAGFGGAIPVDVSNVGGFEPIPATPIRTIFAIPDVAIIKSGPQAGRAVISWTSEEPNNSNDTDIVVRFTDDGGATFSPVLRVNDDFTATSQFYGALRVDPVSGTLVMAWYDARNDVANNRMIQVYASASFDGGATWEPNMRIADGVSDQQFFTGPAFANEFLDYLGLRIHDGCAFVSWSDNSDFLGGSGQSSCEDYVSRFQFR